MYPKKFRSLLSPQHNLETFKQVGNNLLQKDFPDILHKRLEVVSDLQMRPHYGDEDDTDGLYHSQAKRGRPYSTTTRPLCARVETRTVCAGGSLSHRQQRPQRVYLVEDFSKNTAPQSSDFRIS